VPSFAEGTLSASLFHATRHTLIAERREKMEREKKRNIFRFVNKGVQNINGQ
jgi:hypothetical protein